MWCEYSEGVINILNELIYILKYVLNYTPTPYLFACSEFVHLNYQVCLMCSRPFFKLHTRTQQLEDLEHYLHILFNGNLSFQELCMGNIRIIGNKNYLKFCFI